MLATRLKEYRSAIRNSNIKASPTQHTAWIRATKRKFLAMQIAGRQGLLRKRISAKNQSINAYNCRRLTQFCEQQSADYQYECLSRLYSTNCKNCPVFFYLFRRLFQVQNRNVNMNLTTQSPCSTFFHLVPTSSSSERLACFYLFCRYGPASKNLYTGKTITLTSTDFRWNYHLKACYSCR